MQEFTSLKVSAAEHADLAMQLTTMSTQGWIVINIVSTGTDLIAYLSRSKGQTATPAESRSAATSDTGWAASTTSASGTTATIPANWYKDPSGRYEYRYWDGAKWTDDVARAGVPSKDPPVP